MTDFSLLKGHIPDNIYNEVITIKQIDGPKRMSHFLGQCKTETMFKNFTENLNYSVQALGSMFKKYFPTTELAAEYARQPERIANRIYANRGGNRDEQSGDGWKHRGRGALQLTFPDNQKAFFRFIGLPENSDPALIATTYPLTSAAWFFTTNGLWAICDEGIDDTIITKLSKRVNGGSHGLQERIKFTKEFWNILHPTTV